MLTRIAVCALLAAARLAELAYSRRNLAGKSAVEGAWSRRTYPLIVALHSDVITETLFRGGRVRRLWLVLLFGVQPVRAWVLWSLRSRWNARGAVPGDLEVETGGPYRYVRHPNYGVVAVELFTLPMAFGLRRLAMRATAVNAALLALRIPEEERLLSQRPGYNAHFARKKRFIPGLF